MESSWVGQWAHRHETSTGDHKVIELAFDWFNTKCKQCVKSILFQFEVLNTVKPWGE